MTSFSVSKGGATLKGDYSGEGPGVVLLHAGVADRRMWQGQVAALRRAHRVAAYDRRGFGETSSQDEAFSNVQDLSAVLDYLELETPTLVGCSQGGRVAIDYALTYPNRVRSLVLVAPAVSGAPAPSEMPAEIESLLEELDRADEAEDIERVNQIEAHLWLDGPTSQEGRVSGKARDLFLAMNGAALRVPELTQAQEPPSAYEQLKALTLPTLLLWGSLDFPHVQTRCRHLAETLPTVQVEVMAGAAHLPNLEQSERFNKRLLDFLASV